jgi:hypothetical protein
MTLLSGFDGCCAKFEIVLYSISAKTREPKNGRWNAEQPLVLSTVEAFVPGTVEA